MNRKLNKEECVRALEVLNSNNSMAINIDYIYEIYDGAFDAIAELLKLQNRENSFSIDSYKIVSYILGEYLYSTSTLNEDDLKKFLGNEKIKESMASVAADKYLSLSLFKHHENTLINEYLPPVSSISLYINLMQNIVNSRYARNNPKTTLIVDLLNKSLSISQSIINMLCEGYETGAFATWRTLHECECTLILLDKYGDLAINAYLKHMRYGLAYKNALGSAEEVDSVFVEIKDEMTKLNLKSKDMKKFIEYGWLVAIEEKEPLPTFKLNFRDGLETLAGLHQYSNLYMTSSEILHSTPLLIYSNKEYFYYVTLLNLYESFFRIERVFTTLFLNNIGEEEKARYMGMRQLYYSQLVNIHKRESLRFKSLSKRNAK